MAIANKIFNKIDVVSTVIFNRIGCNGCFGLLLGIILAPFLVYSVYLILNESVGYPKTKPIYQAQSLYACTDEPIFVINNPEGVVAYSEPRPDSQYTIFLPTGSALKLVESDLEIKTKFPGRWNEYNGYIVWSKIKIIGLYKLDLSEQSEFWVISKEFNSNEIHFCNPLS